MNQIIKVVSGIGIIIALGIVIWNYKGSVSVINSLAGNSIDAIKTLQGRA